MIHRFSGENRELSRLKSCENSESASFLFPAAKKKNKNECVLSIMQTKKKCHLNKSTFSIMTGTMANKSERQYPFTISSTYTFLFRTIFLRLLLKLYIGKIFLLNWYKLYKIAMTDMRAVANAKRLNNGSFLFHIKSICSANSHFTHCIAFQKQLVSN